MRESCLLLKQSIWPGLARRQREYLQKFASTGAALHALRGRYLARRKILAAAGSGSMLDTDRDGQVILNTGGAIAFCHAPAWSFAAMSAERAVIDAEPIGNLADLAGWYRRFQTSPPRNPMTRTRQWTLFEASLKYYGVKFFLNLGKIIFGLNDAEGSIVFNGNRMYWRSFLWNNHFVTCAGSSLDKVKFVVE